MIAILRAPSLLILGVRVIFPRLLFIHLFLRHGHTYRASIPLGNPASVVFTRVSNKTASWMQSCALETNASLSVFVERIVLGEDSVECAAKRRE